MNEDRSGDIWGHTWRVLAHYGKSRLDLRNEGQFDELVVDQWLHVEQMGDDQWWIHIGRHDGSEHDVTVWITLRTDGTHEVTVRYGP